jgi:WD40 repeat protein
MLLRFRVANVLSLRDEQELSFVVPSDEDTSGARTLSGQTSGLFAVAWAPDGKTLATASGDNTARIWAA